MFKRAAVLGVSCGVLLAGCGSDTQVDTRADPAAEQQETISNLIEAGFRADDITLVGDDVYVGGDAHVPVESSREMLQRGEGSQEQYRTTNLVDKAVVKKICINPSSTFSGHSRLMEGLDMAIANYNALGLCFTMARGPTTGCSANITAQTTTGSGNSSGYPSGGRPYGTIYIGTGLNTASVDMVEYHITHALGHALGLRHSDYYAHVTCSTGEGSAGVGAIHIPGTPTTYTVGGSIMNSCVRSTESGEFTSSDITAFQYLYRC